MFGPATPILRVAELRPSIDYFVNALAKFPDMTLPAADLAPEIASAQARVKAKADQILGTLVKR